VRVRPFVLDDTMACANLLVQGWRQARLRPAQPVTADRFFVETDGEVILVASRGTKVLGFVSVFRPDAFVHHLYVARSAQGQGIGRMLLTAACRLSSSRATLKCALGNRDARAFYAHLGWTEVEVGDDPTDGPWVRIAAPFGPY
jgi:GNAT superfamily N-acetyltransferase